MAPIRTHSHEELLTLARKMRAAALDGNRDRLEAATSRLYEAFLAHIGTERVDLLRLPSGENRPLNRGQQQIVDGLVRLLAKARTTGPCHCAASAEQLMAQLYLQADNERRALAHLPESEAAVNNRIALVSAPHLEEG